MATLFSLVVFFPYISKIEIGMDFYFFCQTVSGMVDSRIENWKIEIGNEKIHTNEWLLIYQRISTRIYYYYPRAYKTLWLFSFSLIYTFYHFIPGKRGSNPNSMAYHSKIGMRFNSIHFIVNIHSASHRRGISLFALLTFVVNFSFFIDYSISSQ